jgi:hypothetical protein
MAPVTNMFNLSVPGWFYREMQATGRTGGDGLGIDPLFVEGLSKTPGEAEMQGYRAVDPHAGTTTTFCLLCQAPGFVGVRSGREPKSSQVILPAWEPTEPTAVPFVLKRHGRAPPLVDNLGSHEVPTLEGDQHAATHQRFHPRIQPSR